ncbi:hypothetical protein HDV63DRAFT_268646 [Trichoderma sp. SZMC 28014]
MRPHAGCLFVPFGFLIPARSASKLGCAFNQCLAEVQPALPWPRSSLCLSCSCHHVWLILSGGSRIPCAAQSAVGAALGNWKLQGGGQAGRRCNPASSQGTRCSTPAPGVHCGAASLWPGQHSSGPRIVPAARRQGLSRRSDSKRLVFVGR